ncbi:MAG: SusC/RagA family TonB-linked outer membrane protein, partial [Bacteroidaceae bacterium]|nr:SusC/RagA family TonB-linked outer membrane protein [Bacteroidaceae bacterium]
DQNYPGTSAYDLFYAIKTRLPYYYPMTNPDGSIAEYTNSEANPYAMLTKTGYAANKNNTLNATAGVTWDMSKLVTSGLSTTVRLSFDADNYRNVTRSRGYNAYKYSIAETETDLSKGTYANVRTGSETLGYSVSANETRYTLLEAMLNYNHSFGKHNLTGLLMYNQSSKLLDATDAINGLPFRKQGLVGRLTYNYDGKYFGEFNMGYNGSENFKKGHRMGFFPAISFSYVLSEENFIKNIQAIDLLKIRFSYGLVGNDDNGSRFLYQSQWTTGWKGYNFGPTGNGLSLSGAGVYSTGNEDVTWEKAKKLNLGLDLDLWKSALHMTLDVFHERRTDILCSPGTIPTTCGVTSLPSINAGIVTNKGFEIELEHRKIFRDWGYSIKGNFSYATNKIISADEPNKSNKPWQRRSGTHIDEMYGYIAEGLFQNMDEINDKSIAKTTASNLQPGDIRYKDLNNDGVINDDDRGYLGKISTPDKIVGLSLSGNWKNFDLSILFQGALGGYTWFSGSAIWPFESKASVSKDVLNNYWSSNNTVEKNKKVFYPRLSSDHSDNNFINSTYWLKSSDYLRLKNLEIGYRLPKATTRFLGVEEFRFYANGVNLITWDHMKIFDPEAPGGAVNYPQMKVFNLGFHISF